MVGGRRVRQSRNSSGIWYRWRGRTKLSSKIVVVGNHPPARESVAGALRQVAYDVQLLELTQDILGIFELDPPECIIIDLDQTSDFGLELIKLLRQNFETEPVPIIALCPEEAAEHRVHALEAGANLCLHKPWRQSELLSNVAVQLRLWRLQTELQRQNALNQSLLTKLKVDLSLGQQVQQSFLPPFQMRTENFSLEARFIPSGDLSGDYFDYRLITPERLVLFLADISGHGVASALLAGRLKSFFDENYRRAHRPRFLLEKLNHVLIALGEHYHIATAVFIHIDLAETVLVYSSAGHRSLYWLDTETGQQNELSATGPALGMFEEYEIQEVQRSFLPGRNRLVAFTDGLVEFKLPDGTWHSEDQFCQEAIFPRFAEQLDQYVNGLLYRSREQNQFRKWEDDVSLIVADY